MNGTRASRRRFGLAVTTALIGVGSVAAVGSAAAEGPGEPGMCHGRTDASLVVTAHAVGREAKSSPKFVLNIESDASGNVTGVLISGRGADRLFVDDWCRLWQHRPQDEPRGECEGPQPGATVVHAVGTAELRDGTRVLVRVDAKSTDHGTDYRLRSREMGSHHDADDHVAAAPAAHDEGGCGDDEGWTRIPAEGWAPLTMLEVRSA